MLDFVSDSMTHSPAIHVLSVGTSALIFTYKLLICVGNSLQQLCKFSGVLKKRDKTCLCCELCFPSQPWNAS